MNIIITDEHPITAFSQIRNTEYSGHIICTDFPTAVEKFIKPHLAEMKRQGAAADTVELKMRTNAQGGEAEQVVNTLWKDKICCVNNNVVPSVGTLLVCYYSMNYVLVLDLTTGYAI